MPLDSVLPAFLIAVVGYGVGKRFNLDKQTLSRVCLYILVPAMAFNSMATSKVDFGVAWRLALATIIFPFAQAALYLVVFRLMKLDQATSRAMLLIAVFTNAGNYGLPICLFAFGQAGMDLAVVFMVTQTVMLATLGTYIAASSQMDTRTAMRQVLKMPAVYAAVLGVAVRAARISLPDLVGRPVGLLARAAVPVFLILLGMQLIRNGESHAAWRETGIAVFLRLAVGPVIAWLIGLGLGLTGLPLRILVLEGAMPTPVNSTILAQEFDARPGAVSRATMAGTVASVLTLSLWIMLLRLI